MGCGVSRPVIDDHEPIPAGLTPFRRRIEEIRRSGRRVNRRSDSRLSTKELLNNGDDNHSTFTDAEEDFVGDGCRKSFSCGLASIEEDNDVNATPLVMERKMKVTHLPDSDLGPTTAAVLMEEKEKNQGAANGIAVVMEKNDEKLGEMSVEKRDEKPEMKIDAPKQEDYDTDEDDDENRLDGYGSDFVGSPSFREYCFLSDDSDESGKGPYKIKVEKVDETSSQKRESTLANEAPTKTLVKKQEKGERKGLRFRSVLPKGGHIVVRNIFNVRGCYNNTHSHNNHRLTPATTA